MKAEMYCGKIGQLTTHERVCRIDLPPRTSPPFNLDLGPLEVHSREQNRVLVTWDEKESSFSKNIVQV